MTVLAGRRESFNAAHQLCDPDLSDEQNRRLSGRCANLHGHNYVLEVVVAGEVDQATGYLLDLKRLSHHHPAGHPRRGSPQSEHRRAMALGPRPDHGNLARAFWERLWPELPGGLLRSVRVWETGKNWAEAGDKA
jgi:6-pyruvoyltetrahydropterin/6-carboxytetrahydropterin synthase